MSLNSPCWTRRAWLASMARVSANVPLAIAFPWDSSPVLRATQRLIGRNDAPMAQLLDPNGVRALATRALDAARSSGADYTEVRLTRTISQQFKSGDTHSRFPSITLNSYGSRPGSGPHDGAPLRDTEIYGVGIRVLRDGGWGFAAGPFWTLDEMPILAAEAVLQASVNAKTTPRHIDLAATPIVTGSWRPSQVIDPFEIPPEEKIEYLRSLLDYIWLHEPARERFHEAYLEGGYQLTFQRQEWALATSEGSYCTQLLFRSGGEPLKVFEKSHFQSVESWGYSFKTDIGWDPGLVGGGWEICQSARQHIDAAFAEREVVKTAPPTPKDVDIGRYTVVCSPHVAVGLVGRVLGPATELDRAWGYEANAGGTSFLNDPLEMLGTLRLGSDHFNVTANRSTPNALATVKWDDEGVEPDEIPLITNGILTDFQTTRESATWLAPYYTKTGRPVRSHGCSAAADALAFPLLKPANLVMQPGREDVTFDDLVKDVKKGIAFLKGGPHLDRQGLGGVLYDQFDHGDSVWEIVNGQLTQPLVGAGLLFKSTELWNKLIAIGGQGSSVSSVDSGIKGQPEQTTFSTVSAVPFTIMDASVIDVRRR